MHQTLAQLVGLFHGGSFAVDADDRLSVRLAQVYPTVREVNLHTVDVVDLSSGVFGKHLLHLDKDGIDIGLRGQVDAVFGNLVVGELATQFADLAVLLGQRGQEEGDTYQGVTTVMAFRIDDTTITLTTDDSTDFFHLRGHVDLSDGGSGIVSAMLFGDVA